MKEAFEKMTGMPDAWTNPALMVSRNAFIQGWEMCLMRQKQEPVFCEYCGGNDESPPNHCMDYARPQRTWVGLTEEEIQAVAKQARSKDHAVTLTNKLLKEKNNGLL